MRKQRAFVGLKEQEIEQIAEWLRHGTYDQVRERIAKPRPEGLGLDLKSNRPLETLFANQNRFDKINRKIEIGQKLTLAEFNAIYAGEKADVPEQIHDAIMETTCEIVMAGDNTPSQLLGLQRLADFPARAEYRAHKVRMDLHKVDMDDHRKHIASERLELSKRAFDLREKESAAHAAKSNSSSFHSGKSASPREDHLGPLAKDMDGVEARAKMKFGSVSESALGLQSASTNISEPSSPLSHASSEPSSQLTSSSLASCPSVEETTSSPSSVETKDPHPCPSETSAVKNESAPSQLSPLPPVKSSPPVQSLEDRVNHYTLERYHEALHGKDTLKVGKWNAWKFKSKMQWCPCGQHLPCPEHGEFPPQFWELMPDNGEYIEILQRKKIPYTNPHIFMQQEEKRAKRLAAEKELRLQFPSQDARNSMLNERVRSHALRRFYSHTPRPRGTPPPDESWTEECPCGAKLPCDLHSDLWSEVRYLKPWNSDYIDALKREGIPIYTPTDEERHPWSGRKESQGVAA